MVIDFLHKVRTDLPVEKRDWQIGKFSQIICQHRYADADAEFGQYQFYQIVCDVIPKEYEKLPYDQEPYEVNVSAVDAIVDCVLEQQRQCHFGEEREAGKSQHNAESVAVPDECAHEQSGQRAALGFRRIFPAVEFRFWRGNNGDAFV